VLVVADWDLTEPVPFLAGCWVAAGGAGVGAGAAGVAVATDCWAGGAVGVGLIAATFFGAGVLGVLDAEGVPYIATTSVVGSPSRFPFSTAKPTSLNDEFKMLARCSGLFIQAVTTPFEVEKSLAKFSPAAL